MTWENMKQKDLSAWRLRDLRGSLLNKYPLCIAFSTQFCLHGAKNKVKSATLGDMSSHWASKRDQEW